MSWRADVVTLFPDRFPGPLGASVIGRGLGEGRWSLAMTNLRDFAVDNYRTVDDTPAGGGAGMKDAGDDDKSAFSDALKRAAVKWGVGRYLYNDGRPKFVEEIITAAKVKAAESAVLASPGDPEVEAKRTAAKRELASFRLFEARRNVERRPNDLSARQALGLLYLERTQFDDAIAHFQEAQKGSVVRTAALLGLARAYKGKKQYELAVAQFILVKAEPGPLDEQRKEVIYQLGECYELLGRREQAIGEFKAIYAEDVAYRDVAARINAYYTK